MPYGIKGGDTAASTAFMERCVPAVQKSGKSKVQAIIICKAQYAQRKRGKK